MNRYIQVVTTTDTRKLAEKIAVSAIEQHLAACVQVSSCQSMYRWQGRIERADEFTCVMKSRMDLYPELEQVIRREHTYEVPEIVAIEITECSSGYLAWLEKELRSKIDTVE